jgi:hypothetical protein
MSTVVVSPFNVVNAPEVGGHFWVYTHYVLGLQRLGCDVIWLEEFVPTDDPGADRIRIARFVEQMDSYGLRGRIVLYRRVDTEPGFEFVLEPHESALAIFRRADLLLNFHYNITPAILPLFSRTAFVDIDPGLLQFWVSNGQIELRKHDFNFTIGETVGTPQALFPDCGLDWIHIRPAVCLERWPFVDTPHRDAFTTVSSWWGAGGKGEFITDGRGLLYENNKRYSFLRFVDLPRRTSATLELALFMGSDEVDSDSEEVRAKATLGRVVGEVDPAYDGIEMYRYTGDVADRATLEKYGWRVRSSREVAGSPRAYQTYVQESVAEFSCAKPSCMRFQNAWVSDRSLCYLASGRPVVLQNTGPSSFLPDAEGMFRFTTHEEAIAAIETVRADYRRQRRAARELAETYFDAKKIVTFILDRTSHTLTAQTAVADR